jgi:hypothetical protein
VNDILDLEDFVREVTFDFAGLDLVKSSAPHSRYVAVLRRPR